MGNLSTSINRKSIYLHRSRKMKKKSREKNYFFAKCGAQFFKKHYL